MLRLRDRHPGCELARAGLQYTNFHVTPLCSPTRASLLTGRNHHSVGMSMLSNADSGFPGKRGSISHSAATIAEVLRDEGYNTAAFGKWHLAPIDQTTSIGPFDQWPLGRGFERFYGFLEGITDQFYPELVCDNHRIDPPATPEEGYHLSEDLVDQTMAFISGQKSLAPEKPFFAYLAFGAGHTPHHAPKPFLEKYRGRYDAGWDEIRARRHARQIELGVIPDGTLLAPRNPGVEPWNSFDEDARAVMARMQEAFAAMLDHTDVQLGRLMAHLEALGLRDDTAVIFMSDNGASQEGGPIGCVNTIAYENGDQVSLADNLAMIEDIGGPRANNNYPWGWAQAGNTPLKRYKQNTHAGGIRAPLVVSWPGGVPETTERIRSQFHSVIDITPTILEITGTTMPDSFHGVAQMPVHGTSLAYTFVDNPPASRRETQYFEMYGHRAIWHDGWKAVAYHERGTSYDDDRWELYHLDTDFSECLDRAEQRPDVLNELVGRWWSEADRYQVFPLDDRGVALFGGALPRLAAPGERALRVPPTDVADARAGVAAIAGRNADLTARLTIAADDEGVLFATGTQNSGMSWFVQDRRLVVDYNAFGAHTVVESTDELPTGEVEVVLQLRRGDGMAGSVALLVDGRPAGQADSRCSCGSCRPSARASPPTTAPRSPLGTGHRSPSPARCTRSSCSPARSATPTSLPPRARRDGPSVVPRATRSAAPWRSCAPPTSASPTCPTTRFAPHYVEVDDGEGGTLRVHYLDEGPPDADVVLLLHGEPSWSLPLPQDDPGARRRRAAGGRPRPRRLRPLRQAHEAHRLHVRTATSTGCEPRSFDRLDLHDITLGRPGLGRAHRPAPRRPSTPTASPASSPPTRSCPTGDSTAGDAFLAWQKFSQDGRDFHVGSIVNGGCTHRRSPAEVAAVRRAVPRRHLQGRRAAVPDARADHARRPRPRRRTARRGRRCTASTSRSSPRSPTATRSPAAATGSSRSGSRAPGPAAHDHRGRRPLPPGGRGSELAAVVVATFIAANP